MVSADEILEAICLEFDADPEKVRREYVHSRIRRIYWYMCRLYLPVEAKLCNYGRVKPVLGSLRPLARAIGASPESIRRACIEVEDRRDDPHFNSKLEKIERRFLSKIGVAA